MGERPPEEVKIKLKHGQWEVEITCIESRVKQVVENVLASLDASQIVDPDVRGQLDELRREIDMLKKRPVDFKAGEIEQQKAAKGGVTCKGLLETLLSEGYFETGRSLGEIHDELARRGYNYDRTAVSHSLTDMARESKLERQGKMRTYRYIQKRPPGS